MLEQDEITDTEYYFAEDQILIAFLKATQKDTFESLETDYGADAGDEIFKALKNELRISPLWLIIRHGLTVRGLEFKLYFPKPRSSESVALMTMHTAKGLEFPIVFICGVEEELIPYDSGHREYDLEKERRLFYVGMTRAMDKHILTN